MTPSELTTRVTVWSGVALAALAAPSGWVGGPRVALGLVAGGALALLSFRWLAGRAAVLVPGAAPSPWAMLAALRWGAVAVAAAALLVTGLAEPAALLAGTVVPPCAVLVVGLRAAPREP